MYDAVVVAERWNVEHTNTEGSTVMDGIRDRIQRSNGIKSVRAAFWLSIAVGVVLLIPAESAGQTDVAGAEKNEAVVGAAVQTGQQPPQSEGSAPPVVAGAMKADDSVAATPISIPRPIQLSKLTDWQVPAAIAQQARTSSILNRDPREQVLSAEIVSQMGNEVRLRVSYEFNSARPMPVYAGAYIYDAEGVSVDAGYKPAVAGRPDGLVDITIVLPDAQFQSHHVVTFFMESGQPVFMNARFLFPYRWRAGTLFEVSHKTAAFQTLQGTATVALSNADFCEAYANAAIAQYDYAVEHGVPGIEFPVWSDNFDHHYNWCLSVPRESAEQGAAMRQSQIERSSATVKETGLIAGSDHAKPVTGTGVDALVTQKGPSVTDRQLDPGLGP